MHLDNDLWATNREISLKLIIFLCMASYKIDFREMHHSAPQNCSHGYNFWYKRKILTVKNAALVEFFSLFQTNLEMKKWI